MNSFKEGGYNPEESKIDAHLVDELLVEFDRLKGEGNDFVTARSEALKNLRIPGELWRDFSSALSAKLSARKKIKPGEKKSPDRKWTKLSLESLINESKSVERERGGDLED